jgi:oligoribonuclease
MSDSTRLVWMDMEMTGLDPEQCAIIELAVIVTDGHLRPLGELERVVWQPERVLQETNPFVREMHTKNGLLDKVRASTTGLDDAERELLTLISTHCKFREGILAGNSIHQDRRFLARHMPAVERYLHYRQVDVTTLKVLAQAFGYHEAKYTKSNEDHTALADIRSSMDELRHYRKHLFRPAL